MWCDLDTGNNLELAAKDDKGHFDHVLFGAERRALEGEGCEVWLLGGAFKAFDFCVGEDQLLENV